MRFTCGMTVEERMRRFSEWLDQQREWQRVFLLVPRSIAERDGLKVCAWLETVERRWTGEFTFDGRFKNEYRFINGDEPQSGRS